MTINTAGLPAQEEIYGMTVQIVTKKRHLKQVCDLPAEHPTVPYVSQCATTGISHGASSAVSTPLSPMPRPAKAPISALT